VHWLNKVDVWLGASMQYASGRRVLTPEAEQRKETRTIADARRDLIECQNELDVLRRSPDLKSTTKKNKTTKKCKVLYQKTNSALAFLRGQNCSESILWSGYSESARFGYIHFLWRRLIHSKGARTSAASTPIGPRARL
jgi:hypothetical protein